MTTAYQITTANACFGIEVEDGVVTEAAPIAGKVIGMPWSALQARYAARGASVAAVTEGRALWVRDRRTKAIVGYLADGVLVRLANAGELYARAMKQVREGVSV